VASSTPSLPFFSRVESINNYKEEYRVLESRVLGRIFRFPREEVIGRWREIHNAELHNSH
jgi:hypothetical protein